jgi:hypothetical protein
LAVFFLLLSQVRSRFKGRGEPSGVVAKFDKSVPLIAIAGAAAESTFDSGCRWVDLNLSGRRQTRKSRLLKISTSGFNNNQTINTQKNVSRF